MSSVSPAPAAAPGRPPQVTPDAVAEPMNAIDRAWFEMDEPRNPMIVASIMEFDGVADAAALAAHLVARLIREPRFRQRIVAAEGGYAWIEDDALHLGYHVREHRLGRSESAAELRAAIGAELGKPLDRAMPLWRIVLFPHGRRRLTVLFRAHHAIADGVAMMQGLLHLDDGATTPPPHPAPAKSNGHHGPLAGVLRRLETVNDALETLTDFVADELRHPGQVLDQVRDVRRTLGAVARVVALPDDNPPALRAALSGRRAVAWTGDLVFAAVRELARAQHVTINDIFLTALAGAFGRWLRGTDGQLREGQNLRVSVPVNLRAQGDGTAGNFFGLVMVDLPVGLEGWHARLDVIADRMAALKHSPEARATLVALAAAGHLPVAAEKTLVSLVGNKAAAVVSNLPGPRTPLTIGGARLANVVFWPPQTARVGVGVSLLSYAGRVTVGVSADTALIAHPQAVIDGFIAELTDMLGGSPLARSRGAGRRAAAAPTARSQPGVHHGKT